MFHSPNNSIAYFRANDTGVPLLGALFGTLTLAKAHLAAHIDVTTAPAEALVYGVQNTFRVTALILCVASVLTAVVWRMERSSRQKF